jgi:hypothetical protein
MKSTFFRLFSFSMALSLVLLTTAPAAPAYAGMVGTTDVLAMTDVAADRERILEVLARDDVRAQLERHGVSLEQAQARVAALSADEARAMAERLDQMPAGAANTVIGVLFTVFIILLVTDLLGLTAVFPFTRR